MHPEVFNRIGKGETIEDIKKGVKIFQDNDIEVSGYLIVGLPGDNLERTLYSYEETVKLGLDSLALSSAVSYSGTRLEKWVADGNARVVSDPFSVSAYGSQYDNIAYETDDFSVEDRKKARHLISLKAQGYVDYSLPKWLFWFKKISMIMRYDRGNFLRRIKRSIRYRMRKKYLDKFMVRKYVYFGRIPDGTWGLAKDEALSLSGEKATINLSID